MLSRGDFGAIMHVDIHPPLYVTSNTVIYIYIVDHLRNASCLCAKLITPLLHVDGPSLDSVAPLKPLFPYIHALLLQVLGAGGSGAAMGGYIYRSIPKGTHLAFLSELYGIYFLRA
jgi:hypothetical protein